MSGLAHGLVATARTAVRRLAGRTEEDEWGFDPDLADGAQPLFDLLHDRWWRIATAGLAHVPQGPALVAANHAGLLPWDAAMLSTVLARAGRRPRVLLDPGQFGVPWAAPLLRRLGAVPAAPANALRLLEHGHLVVAFPEGTRAAVHPWRDRYRLGAFGGAGVVELALQAGVPIVPCAVVGSEELHPRLAAVRGLPVTPTFPLLGPLGLVGLPSRWRIAFGVPLDLAVHGAAAVGDRGLVLELADELRDRLQALLLEELAQRRRTFR